MGLARRLLGCLCDCHIEGGGAFMARYFFSRSSRCSAISDTCRAAQPRRPGCRGRATLGRAILDFACGLIGCTRRRRMCRSEGVALCLSKRWWQHSFVDGGAGFAKACEGMRGHARACEGMLGHARAGEWLLVGSSNRILHTASSRQCGCFADQWALIGKSRSSLGR